MQMMLAIPTPLYARLPGAYRDVCFQGGLRMEWIETALWIVGIGVLVFGVLGVAAFLAPPRDD